MSQNKISLIVPSYKNPECLDLCLMSAIDNKKLNSTEIIVTIDGYPDVSKHLIDKYQDKVNFVIYEENTGMQNAINVAVYQSVNNYIFVINEDNVMPTNWDDRILNVIESENKDKCVYTIKQIERVPSIYNFHIEDFGSNPGNFNYEEFLKKEIQLSNNKLTNDGGLFPFVINKKHFMTVGGFDIGFPSPHVVDYDFFNKLEYLEMEFKMVHNISLYHFGQMSTKKIIEEVESFNERERLAYEYYKFKWGDYPVLKTFNK